MIDANILPVTCLSLKVTARKSNQWLIHLHQSCVRTQPLLVKRNSELSVEQRATVMRLFA